MKTILTASTACLAGVLVGLTIRDAPDITAGPTIGQIARELDQRILMLKDDLQSTLALHSSERLISQPAHAAPLPLSVDQITVADPQITERLDRIEMMLRDLPKWMSGIRFEGIPIELRIERQVDRIGDYLNRLSSDFQGVNAELFGLSPAGVYGLLGQPSLVEELNNPERRVSLRWSYEAEQGASSAVGRGLRIDFAGGLVSLVALSH